jgi:tetratricopeptide (TPR) repeat protein
VLYQPANRNAEAETLHQRALGIRKRVLSHEHPNVARSLMHLALLYGASGHNAPAELLLRRAIAIGAQSLGSDHPEVAVWLKNLAALYRASGRHAEAEPLLRRAVGVLEAKLPPSHPNLASARGDHGALVQPLPGIGGARLVSPSFTQPPRARTRPSDRGGDRRRHRRPRS